MSEPVDLERLAELLWADVDDDAAPPSASDLNIRSFQAAVEQPAGHVWPATAPTPGAPRLDLRLHGRAIEGHVAPVRLAAKALTVVQDLVTAMGMAQSGKKSLFGTAPTDILEATELSLSPAAAPGSLIFELRASESFQTDDQLAGADTGVTLADTAAAEIFSLLDLAAGDGGATQDAALVTELQRLGPRVSSHFRRLNKLALKEALRLDFRWEQGNGETIAGRIDEFSASELDRVITQSRVSLEHEVIHGHLVTISTEDELVIRDRSGRRIPLQEGEGFAQDPAEFYDRDVAADVEVEVEGHPTTGRDVRTYYLVRLRDDDAPTEGTPVALDV